ncbi:MAG TPA: ABC transporter permease subunit [Nitrospirales bacterium]|nr:ABC transporter permease subunit [Nitrospirales bacterium]
MTMSPRRRLRGMVDQFAGAIIRMGGIGIILSILGIFVFLVAQAIPLFFSPTGSLTRQIDVGTTSTDLPQATLVGINDGQSLSYVLTPDTLSFLQLPSGNAYPVARPPALEEANITAVAQMTGDTQQLALGTDDGHVIPMRIRFRTVFDDTGTRETIPKVAAGPALTIDPTHGTIVRLAYQKGDDGISALGLNNQGHLWYGAFRQLDPGYESTQPPVDLSPHITGTVTSLVMDGLGEAFAAGTSAGELYYWKTQYDGPPALIGVYRVAPARVAITALAYLIGDRSLIVGTAEGAVSVWTELSERQDHTRSRLQAIHHLAPHSTPVTVISASKRNKGFITSDTIGSVHIHHATSEQTLLRIPGHGTAITALMFAPKANGAVALTADGNLLTYDIENPHPEITLKTLFGKVWYEGYDKPEFVWQSSGATDDVEPKFSLTPITLGTLKGTFYALLLAVPLAVLSAIYTSMFMHPSLRATIKPTVEIMAALPTVVLGFLAGLWLAPLIEDIFPALLGMLIVIPCSVLTVSLLWQLVPGPIRKRMMHGMEALILIPIIGGATALCYLNTPFFEQLLFGGDYKAWLDTSLGLSYDQRNAIIIGFAMGFAIIPIIYSISEEALSNVPKRLIAASLGLGATPWQTLTRLVLVAAAPGIFSAIMMGFGRAVGETMIVLMATGNTPIMDINPFNGFRTLAANIAVEIPEAPQSGTLYRTLFLAALLLFMMTFVVNTIAEVIRQRMRKQYSQF